MPHHQTAAALLARCRQSLTGREMQVCEAALSGESAGIPAEGYQEDPETILTRLTTEFSREIGEWSAETNRAHSRRVVETHSRLHAAA